MEEKIIRTEYSEIMQKSYIDYAMSVIVSRALPDVRDGLKPVQRRTLYDMHELGIRHDKPYRKSARIVGDTMGKYHPHGDSSIYGALVVLTQDFKMGVPLVDGHGNFGSIEGDGAAAMRYTEARLEKITEDMFLADLDKDVVDFGPNFDETEKEPLVLPARFPNLLVNGSEGIAVGMVTSIPPHNLGEVIDAVVAMIEKGDISDEELFTLIPGPDFPTGGIVTNKDELAQIYQTGTGKIRVRGRVETEEVKGGKTRLVITEIPYTMLGANIGKFMSDIAALAESRQAPDITDISNQSSKDGIRIVLELRKGADVENLKNLLYKKTRLEDTFGVNMLAVADGKPETLSLRSVLEHHIDFQFEVATRKYRTLLERERKKSEVQEGLIRAVDVIDLIIEILRGSRSQKQVRDCLIRGITDDIKFKTEKSRRLAAKLRFTEVQADAILEMRLAKLIGLEMEALIKEHEETLKKIDRYQDILDNYSSMAAVIVRDLKQIKKEFGRPRRTGIENAAQAVIREEEPEDFPVVVLMDRFGYVRGVDETVFERNREAAESECRLILHCMNSSVLCVYTDVGRQHLLKVSAIPFGKFRDKGTPVDNLCNYDSAQESIVAIFRSDALEGQVLLFATKMGFVKRVEPSEFALTRKTIAAAKLQDGDKVLSILPLSGEEGQVVLETKNGYLLKLSVADIPVKKKTAVGVQGIRLTSGDALSAVYDLAADPGACATVGAKTVELAKLRTGSRATRGSRPK